MEDEGGETGFRGAASRQSSSPGPPLASPRVARQRFCGFFPFADTPNRIPPPNVSLIIHTSARTTRSIAQKSPHLLLCIQKKNCVFVESIIILHNNMYAGMIFTNLFRKFFGIDSDIVSCPCVLDGRKKRYTKNAERIICSLDLRRASVKAIRLTRRERNRVRIFVFPMCFELFSLWNLNIQNVVES